ncbi:tyrosine-type recombinase/integrase, partial [Pantoea sp. SIMBA_133]
KQRLDWLQPEQAYRLFKVAEKEDGEFAAFLVFLCYTGCRLSDALNLTCDHVVLPESFAFFEKTKNDEPRSVPLPPIVVTSLANLPKG